MIIIHSLDNLEKSLFHNIHNIAELKIELEKFYSYDGYTPKVTIKGNFIEVDIDMDKVLANQQEYDHVVELCEKGKFEEAIPLLRNITANSPLFSDGFRTLGQALDSIGRHEEAIDMLIEALRIDPANSWALIMMGNIYAKEMNDIDTAMLYYNSVLEKHPDNNIALNNVGGNLLSQKKYEEAESFFLKAIKINNKYSRSYLGLSFAYQGMGRYFEAFEHASHALEIETDYQLRLPIIRQMMDTAESYTKNTDCSYMVEELRVQLEKRGGIKIVDEERPNLDTDAALKMAWDYHTPTHKLVFNKDNLRLNHLKLHELVHLVFILDAKDDGCNEIIYSTEENEKKFMKDFLPIFRKIHSRIDGDRIKDILKQTYMGLMKQLANCVLDMYVEDYIYDHYPAMRPVQFMSLMQMNISYYDNINKPEMTKMFPQRIVTLNKSMLIASAWHLKLLYGVNSLNQFKPTKQEYYNAEKIIESFKFYRKDKAPGEEYDVERELIEILSVGDYISIDKEENIRKGDPHSTLKDHLDSLSPDKREQEEKFQDQHKDGEDATQTFMMSMYMLAAMDYFTDMPMEEIKKIAMQIAMLGVNGISPDKKSGYRVPNVDKDFGGYQLLAWYYVSWAWAIPEMLDSLNLPFKNAYATAKQMYDSKHKK